MLSKYKTLLIDRTVLSVVAGTFIRFTDPANRGENFSWRGIKDFSVREAVFHTQLAHKDFWGNEEVKQYAAKFATHLSDTYLESIEID